MGTLGYKYILYGYMEPLGQEREAKEKEAAVRGLRAHGSGFSGFRAYGLGLL